MNYPRKRAPIACNFCRHRKRKCDGNRPACKLCREASITCDYQEITPERHNPTSAELLRRIEELENIVRQTATTNPLHGLTSQSQGQDDDGSLPQTPAPRPTRSANLSPQYPAPVIESYSMALPSMLPPGQSNTTNAEIVLDFTEDEPLTIPIGHLTTAGSLFQLEPLIKLIGEYPVDFLFQIESQRSLEPLPIDSSDLLALDLTKETTDRLLDKFFANVHQENPILEQSSFLQFFDDVIRNDSSDDSDRGFCLIILALGKIGDSSKLGESPDDGLEYFSAGYHILITRWVTAFGMGTSIPLGLIYAAIYLFYVDRPLHAWRLTHMASTKLQLMASQLSNSNISQESHDCIVRLFWACFLLECDVLAEFHLPRSGIEVVVDGMPFPRFNNHIDHEGLKFLSDCSMRRLLNRIHRTIYATDSSSKNPLSVSATGFQSISNPETSTLESVCTELFRQLETWYHSLPASIKPNLDSRPHHIHKCHLLQRYWSARHIISRPFLVLAASSLPSHEIPSLVMENSKICVESCRNFINIAEYTLSQRTRYTWATIHSCLASILVIIIASTSPLLEHLVPDTSEMISKVISIIKPWSSSGSSTESISWILNSIYQKQHLQHLSNTLDSRP